MIGVIVYGISGAFAPDGNMRRCSGMRTFSVGIYPILPKASGEGTKRGKVRVRVSGLVADQEAVFARAREIAAQLEAGKYVGPKNVVARIR